MKDIVIKIQRPNIKEKMEIDFDILLNLSEKFSKIFKDSVVNPKEILLEIKLATEKELNFNFEATNIEKFRSLNKDIPCIYAPYIINEYTVKCKGIIGENREIPERAAPLRFTQPGIAGRIQTIIQRFAPEGI